MQKPCLHQNKTLEAVACACGRLHSVCKDCNHTIIAQEDFIVHLQSTTQKDTDGS